MKKNVFQNMRAGDGRVTIFCCAVIFLGVFFVYRIAHFAFISVADSAEHDLQKSEQLPDVLERGNIYMSDQNGKERKLVATNRVSLNVVVDTANPDTLRDDYLLPLAHIIGETQYFEARDLLRNTTSRQITILSNISRDVSIEISKLNIKGISIISRNQRYYPYGGLAAHVIGFLGYNQKGRLGQYGVEGYYEPLLSGAVFHSNYLDSELPDLLKQQIKTLGPISSPEATSTKQGPLHIADIVLTLDFTIQSFLEREASDLMNKWQAAGVSILVQDPKTGAILGMASSPSFDPSAYSRYGIETYLNPAVQTIYEPGSSFKPITMSAALDKKVLNPNTTFTDTGEYNVDGFKIHNFDLRAYGLQTMSQVLQKSLNTGTIFAKNLLGDDDFLNYIVRFGFGTKTAIDLEGEVPGSIANLYTQRKSNFATASFGQGLSVTPIQLITAYSALANGGHLMRPYVAGSIELNDGSVVKTSPMLTADVISPKTSDTINKMLTDVVDYGFDKARIKGYDIAGKTGTAQIADGKGKYLEGGVFTHNFLGYAPASDPRFVILIKMDKPKGVTFAADSLSPAFAQVSAFLINYMHILPTRK